MSKAAARRESAGGDDQVMLPPPLSKAAASKAPKKPRLSVQSRFQFKSTATRAEDLRSLAEKQERTDTRLANIEHKAEKLLNAFSKYEADTEYTWKKLGNQLRPRILRAIVEAPGRPLPVVDVLSGVLPDDKLFDKRYSESLRIRSLGHARDIRLRLRKQIKRRLMSLLASAKSSLKDFRKMNRNDAVQALANATAKKDVFHIARCVIRKVNTKDGVLDDVPITAELIFFIYEHIGRLWTKASVPKDRSRVDKCRRSFVIRALDSGDHPMAEIDAQLCNAPDPLRPSAELVGKLKLPSWLAVLKHAELDAKIESDEAVQAKFLEAMAKQAAEAESDDDELVQGGASDDGSASDDDASDGDASDGEGEASNSGASNGGASDGEGEASDGGAADKRKGRKSNEGEKSDGGSGKRKRSNESDANDDGAGVPKGKATKGNGESDANNDGAGTRKARPARKAPKGNGKGGNGAGSASDDDASDGVAGDNEGEKSNGKRKRNDTESDANNGGAGAGKAPKRNGKGGNGAGKAPEAPKANGAGGPRTRSANK